jgi:YD repeat-containing protein
MDGRVRTTIDELGRATDFTDDQRGRLLSHQAPAPTVGANRPTKSFTYSIDSLLTATTDPMGRVTSYEYDNGGRVSRVVAPDPDGAGAQVASYQRFVRKSISANHVTRVVSSG